MEEPPILLSSVESFFVLIKGMILLTSEAAIAVLNSRTRQS